MSASQGPTLTWFSAAVKELDKQHGPKLSGTQIDELRKKLGEVEELYKSLPDDTTAEKSSP